jgi:hypothetical protein
MLPGGIRKKQKFFRILSIRGKYYKANSSKPERRGIIGLFKKWFTSSVAQADGVPLPRQQSQSRSAGSKSQQICETHTHSDPNGHRYVHWCIPWTSYLTRMDPLQLCQIYSDRDFFFALKTRYYHAKSRSRRLLSFKKPVALRFVKASTLSHSTADVGLTATSHSSVSTINS